MGRKEFLRRALKAKWVLLIGAICLAGAYWAATYVFEYENGKISPDKLFSVVIVYVAPVFVWLICFENLRSSCR